VSYAASRPWMVFSYYHTSDTLARILYLNGCCRAFQNAWPDCCCWMGTRYAEKL